MHTLAKKDLAAICGGTCWDDDDVEPFDFTFGVDPFSLVDTYIEPPWLQYTLKAGVVILALGIMVAFVMNASANDNDYDDC